MDHTRHMAIFNVRDLSVSLIGAGGIGATTALTLAKMGVSEMCIYDDDVVSEENLATQLHAVSEVGNDKVDALESVLNLFSDEVTLYTFRRRVDANTTLHGDIIISAVDSINARKDIWQAVKHSGARWYIEARMAAEELQLHVVDTFDGRWYEDYIASQNEEDYPSEPCTAKATFFTAMISGGAIGSVVKTLHMEGACSFHKLIYNIKNQEMLKL